MRGEIRATVKNQLKRWIKKLNEGFWTIRNWHLNSKLMLSDFVYDYIHRKPDVLH